MQILYFAVILSVQPTLYHASAQITDDCVWCDFEQQTLIHNVFLAFHFCVLWQLICKKHYQI